MRRAPPQSSLSSTPPGARAHAQAAAPRLSPPRYQTAQNPAPHERLRSTAPVFPSRHHTTHDLLSLGLRARACPAPSAAATTASSPLLVSAYASILDVHGAARPQHRRASHWIQRIRHGTETPRTSRTRRRGDGCARTVSTCQCRAGQCGPRTTALYAPPPRFPLPVVDASASRLTAWSSPSQSP
ncbi:hypothetical protein B0H11DRAFT_2121228 [Mycena galericulata]|nr:hypothetical protein B0H11DRAFT_2121228 [Mycena galericulata]